VDDQKVSSCAILRPDGAACAGASTLSLFPQAPHGGRRAGGESPTHPPPPPKKKKKKKKTKITPPNCSLCHKRQE